MLVFGSQKLTFWQCSVEPKFVGWDDVIGFEKVACQTETHTDHMTTTHHTRSSKYHPSQMPYLDSYSHALVLYHLNKWDAII